jgi:dUTP pyrophosphatase
MKPQALFVKLLSEHATPPTLASSGAAGYDLASAQDQVTVGAHDKALIMTDLVVIIPDGYYGRIAPRSGLAVRQFIDIGAGVIDNDYRGNLAILIINHSNVPFLVRRGDRIAQLIIEKNARPAVHLIDDITDTARGTNGFGSTGINGAPGSGPRTG